MASIFDDPFDRDGIEVDLVGHDEMTLDQYQTEATDLAFYSTDVIYPTLGLAGEAGEVAEKVKKLMRDTDMDLSAGFVGEQIDWMDKRNIALEVGDILWYCANLLNDIDYSLEEVAQMNLDKLRDRRDRHVMTGSGDHR